jgi:hypothetical protein
MRVPAPRLARSVRGTLIGLLVLGPAGAGAQEPAPVPSLRLIASGGFAMGMLGYRFGTFELAGGAESGTLFSTRLLVGSRPEVQCGGGSSDPMCDERAGYAALLGGVQWAASDNESTPYVGGHLGIYSYSGGFRGSTGLTAAAQVGLRLRIGSFGGAYGDVSCLLMGLGCIPVAGFGLYFVHGPSGGPGG